jgi:hypothetical protein
MSTELYDGSGRPVIDSYREGDVVAFDAGDLYPKGQMHELKMQRKLGRRPALKPYIEAVGHYVEASSRYVEICEGG